MVLPSTLPCPDNAPACPPAPVAPGCRSAALAAAKLRVRTEPAAPAASSRPMPIAGARASGGSPVWRVPGPSPPPPSPFASASTQAFPSQLSGSLGGFSVASGIATPAASSLLLSGGGDSSAALAFAAAFSCVAEEQRCAVPAPTGLSWRELAAASSTGSGSPAASPGGSLLGSQGNSPLGSLAAGPWSAPVTGAGMPRCAAGWAEHARCSGGQHGGIPG